jgi:arylsulfatase A
MWSFQPAHMEYLKTAIPNYFELYDVSHDISQEDEISSKYPEQLSSMKYRMLQMREEMIRDGGDWYR